MRLACTLCRVSCTSFKSFCEHMIGQKHKAAVAKTAPEELEKLGRLQYFIYKCMKKWAIIGLEYVVEKQVDSSYMYTCMLCDQVLNCQDMVAHITEVEHMENYIHRHHKHMYDSTKYSNRETRLKALGRVAKTICRKYGRRHISVKKSRVSSKSQDTVAASSSKEDDKKNGSLPSKMDDPQTTCVQAGVPNSSEKQRLECSKGNSTLDNCSCNICGTPCNSFIALCQHVLGTKHYRKLEAYAPEQLKQLGSLNHFLRYHLSEIPVLGLEHVTEFKEGLSYIYYCDLCSVEANMLKIVGHILDIEHMERYIVKHHDSLLPPGHKGLKKEVLVKSFRDVATKIQKTYGRKEIVLMTADDLKSRSLPWSDRKISEAFKHKEGDVLPPKYDSRSGSQAKRRPLPRWELPSDESNECYSHEKNLKTDGPPLAKRSRHLPEEYQHAFPGISMYRDPKYNESQLPTTSTHVPDLRYTTGNEELEFRTNEQFLQYLANFEIKDDEDATFIQKITQNCISALKNFQEEESEKQKLSHKPEASFAHTSRTYPDTPNFSEIRTESHSSAFETTFLKDAPNLPLGIPQNEVTNFFFNSIKNMDESEVVGVFHRIAATNPEFQAMNIPAIIQFLKESGRLKQS